MLPRMYKYFSCFPRFVSFLRDSMHVTHHKIDNGIRIPLPNMDTPELHVCIYIYICVCEIRIRDYGYSSLPSLV